MPSANSTPLPGEEEFARMRADMVAKQIVNRGVRDSAVLEVMRSLPRHEFVPAEFRSRAYEDSPIAIGEGQTISQPYIVAAMTAALHLQPTDRVLEIGAGSGYQTAILCRLAAEVFAIEVRPTLAKTAAQKLTDLGYRNVQIFERDGSLGLPEHAPYNAILAAAAAPSVPEPLKQQLADHGRLILPVGAADRQQLQLITRLGTSFISQRLDSCQFVPLIGYYGWPESPH